MAINLDQMTTETRNQKTMALDTMTVHDFATVMNAEDQTVAQSVQQALPAIEAAIQTISHSLKKRRPPVLYRGRHQWPTGRFRCSRMRADLWH